MNTFADHVQLHSDHTQRRSSIRTKYSNPCDLCALRKVRCDRLEKIQIAKRDPTVSESCSRCLKNGVNCTNIRLKKKSGPKVKARLTKADEVQKEKPCKQSPKVKLSPPLHGEILSIDKLLPYLQVYQTWYYGVWPVISVAHLVSKIVQDCTNNELNEKSATSYSLCCAICAAISKQITFLSSSSQIINIPNDNDASLYVSESLKARSIVDYKLNPSYESLLTSFFLYVYYINNKGGTNASILYLREAISMAQILKLHDKATLLSKPSAEAHRLKKIYYLLLVTERFMCIEDKIPVILDASIPLPSLEDEEYPGLLTGFTELIKIFAIPDRSFFDNISNLSDSELSCFKILNDFLNNDDKDSSLYSMNWIINVQKKLMNIKIINPTSDIQKANILLSKHWMRSLTWHISYQKGILRKITNDSNNCLSFNYPVSIAYDFLSNTNDLPIYAFESNGPGVCIKLLEIANGLADSINNFSLHSNYNEFSSYNALNSIFGLIGKFKTELTLPIKLYQKIETIVNNRPIPKMPEPSGYITEVNENESQNSPFTEMANIFATATSSYEAMNGRAQHYNQISLNEFSNRPILESTTIAYSRNEVDFAPIDQHSGNSLLQNLVKLGSLTNLNHESFYNDFS